MKSVQIQFNDIMLNILRQFVGKTFTKFKCDPFVFSNDVYLQIGLFINKSTYLLTNAIEVLDYFGAPEDISVFKIRECEESEIKSGLKNITLIDNPVNAKIKEIHVIQENQQYLKDGFLEFELTVTRGLIFILDENREISFEKCGPFSEDFRINKGNNLIDKFEPIDNSNSESDPGDEFKTTRTTLIIK